MGGHKVHQANYNCDTCLSKETLKDLSENPKLHVQLHLLHKTVDKPILDVYKTALLLLKRYVKCEVRASAERLLRTRDWPQRDDGWMTWRLNSSDPLIGTLSYKYSWHVWRSGRIEPIRRSEIDSGLLLEWGRRVARPTAHSCPTSRTVALLHIYRRLSPIVQLCPKTCVRLVFALSY